MSVKTASRALQGIKNSHFIEVDRKIENIIQNVVHLAKTSKDTSTELKIKMAKLKRERIQAVALVARSQAVLADTEALIAEIEIDNELRSLKRRSPNLKNTSSTKKAKLNDQSPKPPSPAKQAPKETSKSDIENKENRFSNNIQSRAVGKDICGAFAAKSKQIVIIDNPPMRNDNSNITAGYITPKFTQDMQRYAQKDNSIYNRPQPYFPTNYVKSGNNQYNNNFITDKDNMDWTSCKQNNGGNNIKCNNHFNSMMEWEELKIMQGNTLSNNNNDIQARANDNNQLTNALFNEIMHNNDNLKTECDLDNSSIETIKIVIDE